MNFRKMTAATATVALLVPIGVPAATSFAQNEYTPPEQIFVADFAAKVREALTKVSNELTRLYGGNFRVISRETASGTVITFSGTPTANGNQPIELASIVAGFDQTLSVTFSGGTASTAGAKAARTRKVTFKKQTKTLKGGSRYVIKIRLSKKQRAALRKSKATKRLKVKYSITARDTKKRVVGKAFTRTATLKLKKGLK